MKYLSYLILCSSSEIKQEVCELIINISQGTQWYKVFVVGKTGKLNETIEVSAFWSILHLACTECIHYVNLPYQGHCYKPGFPETNNISLTIFIIFI